MRLPARFQIELASRACCDATEDPGVGWKREWNPSQFIHWHSRGDSYGSQLADLDRPLSNDMAAQDLAGCAVDDQLAEAGCPPVDDRACSRVKADNRRHHVVVFTR